jgi:hypothetical protein
MSHRERRIVAFAVAILVITPCLWAGPSHASTRPPGTLGAATTLESAALMWRAAVSFWIPLGPPAAAARHRSHGGGAGFGPTPTCDAGPSADPNGRCVGRSVRRPVLVPACDAGPSIDPSGGCPGH